jgi:putative FmdB family regulatory protein
LGLKNPAPSIIEGFAPQQQPSSDTMPIYAYKCAACGFAKDVLQKISDPQLTECPQCGAQSFNKQITAAGFQLKGSGWYATDFRGGSSQTAEKSTDKAADSAKSESKPAESSSSKSDTPPAAAGPSGGASRAGR